MSGLREHRLLLFAAGLTALIVVVNVAAALGAPGLDDAADESGTILVGTGGRLIAGVDHDRYTAPEGAIGLNHTGDVLITSEAESTYGGVEHLVKVYAAFGKVQEAYTLTWVYDGPADHVFPE